jgi:hypothetical protein
LSAPISAVILFLRSVSLVIFADSLAIALAAFDTFAFLTGDFAAGCTAFAGVAAVFVGFAAFGAALFAVAIFQFSLMLLTGQTVLTSTVLS